MKTILVPVLSSEKRAVRRHLIEVPVRHMNGSTHHKVRTLCGLELKEARRAPGNESGKHCLNCNAATWTFTSPHFRQEIAGEWATPKPSDATAGQLVEYPFNKAEYS